VACQADGAGLAGGDQFVEQLLELLAGQLGAGSLAARGGRCGREQQERGKGQDRQAPARPAFRHRTLAVVGSVGVQPFE
jgi:hypothetical protein